MLTPAFSSGRGLDLLWAVIDQWAAPCIVRSDRRTWSWDVILAALYQLIDLDISGVSMLSFEHQAGEREMKNQVSAVRPDAQRRKANCINRTTAPTWLPVCSRQVKQRRTVSFCSESPPVFSQQDQFSTWVVQFVPFMHVPFQVCLTAHIGCDGSTVSLSHQVLPSNSWTFDSERKSQCCWLLIELS